MPTRPGEVETDVISESVDGRPISIASHSESARTGTQLLPVPGLPRGLDLEVAVASASPIAE